MTTDTPIIFSRPMIRALLEGRKTQTRRIVSLRNCEFGTFSSGKISKLFWEHADWNKAWADRGFPDRDGQYRNGYLHVPCHDNDDDAFACGLCDERGWSTTTHRLRPKIVAGDRLWVREAVAFIDNSEFGQDSYWQYRADTDGQCFAGDWPAEEKGNPERPRWKPAIHMPREASRMTLLVDAVKVERLQGISEIDAAAEGVSRLFTEEECRRVVGIAGTKPEDHGWTNYLWHGLVGREITSAQSEAWDHQFSSYRYARGSFSSLWARIHGAEAWEQNPFVVAITFRVIKANIDAPEARAAA